MALIKDTDVTRSADSAAEVLNVLESLDRLLERAVIRARGVYGADVDSDFFRGLYINDDEVNRLIRQPPGQPTLSSAGIVDQINPVEELTESIESSTALASLTRTFALSAFDSAIVVIAIATEIDLRYERLFAFLQDDVTRKLPTVELALNLLCESAENKLVQRAHFHSNAPLIRHRILRVIPDPNQVTPSLLAHYLKLDEQITNLLLGEAGLDPRLADFCELTEPSIDWSELSIDTEVREVLPTLTKKAQSTPKSLTFFFHGPRGSERRATAEAQAKTLGRKLLTVWLDRMGEAASAADLWNLIIRQGRLSEAVLYVADLDDVRSPEAARRRQEMFDAVARYQGITVLAGSSLEPPSALSHDVINIPFGILDYASRAACWVRELENQKIEIEREQLELLSTRFRLTSRQIRNAVTTAKLHWEWQAVRLPENEIVTSNPPAGELAAAVRAQCGHQLVNLAHKLDIRYGWHDIVLPADHIAQLNEICVQARLRNVVYDSWGFDRKLSLGKGLNVLFCGPPGTGKTMAAEVIARELNLDLYRIDLSQVINKYIGETEKNLDRIFRAAENSNAILFFDEADALFGKRSEVRDSHDRYANIEISYLLQKMEEYQGVSILATNLRENLDEAFVRRLQAIVEFPFPDEEQRRKIWQTVFPKETPLRPDLNFDLLAREVRLAGGNIKNIALAAAFYAAAEGGAIGMDQLVHAAYREYQKIGRSWNEMEMLKEASAA